MKYYTETIPLPLAEKLKENGMPIISSRQTFSEANEFPYEYIPTYAEVFDWLMESGIYANVYIDKLLVSNGTFKNVYYPFTDMTFSTIKDRKDTWHEAANAAIEKALTLI